MSLTDFFKDLQNDMETYTAHAFCASWQPCQLAQLLPNLKQDEVVAVMDFSENYHCMHQNEVQTAYFSPCEVTLHPMMFYYKACNDDGEEILAKFAIIGISNDPQHDTALMQQFASLRHLIFCHSTWQWKES